MFLEKSLNELFNSNTLESSENSFTLSLSNAFSAGELLTVTFKENTISFLHSLTDIDIDIHGIYFKEITIDNSDSDFINDDIFNAIKSYFEKQTQEFEYALNGRKSQRITILKHIAKVKRLEIQQMEAELKLYQESIKDIIVEEVTRQDFAIGKSVLLKEDYHNINIEHNKKYYIDNMTATFDQNHYHKGIAQYRPYVHFTLGRIKSDGYTHSDNIITNDNYRTENEAHTFQLITIVQKVKFAESFPNYTTNVTSYYITEESKFPEIDGGEIFKHHVITYGSTFFSNHLNRFQRKLTDLFTDKEFKVKDYLIEFKSNNENYMYLILDTDKNFTIGKKRVTDLITLLENNDPNIVKLPKNYVSRSLELETEDKQKEEYDAKEKRLAEFLFPHFVKAIEAL